MPDGVKYGSCDANDNHEQRSDHLVFFGHPLVEPFFDQHFDANDDQYDGDALL